MYILDDKPLPLDTPFNHDGVDYPANWLSLSSPGDRAAIGITEVPDYPRPDDRFYWVTQNADWTWKAVPKNLNELKAQWTDIFKHQSYGLLLPSDWMIVRKIETGTDIPAEWATYRENVRTTCELAISDLESAANIDVFIVSVTTVRWPTSPVDQQPI